MPIKSTNLPFFECSREAASASRGTRNKPHFIKSLGLSQSGNVENVVRILERKKNSHIRAYIRIPDNFSY